MKRIFGVLLTVLGLTSVIYSAVLCVNGSSVEEYMKPLSTFGVVGILFFISGLSLAGSKKKIHN